MLGSVPEPTVLAPWKVSYEILGRNRASIGHWFPAVKEAVDGQDFFKVPKTKIVKVPLPILQLTRMDYQELTRTTLDIVDRFCMEAFDLDEDKAYFIRTGTASSKFDHRNAKIQGAKEVRELGEYLLFIHHQQISLAYPMNVKKVEEDGTFVEKPVSVYGAGTTNEWCVREYIEDLDTPGNPCIYHGLPLRTEYRCFVDFDTDTVAGIFPYWEPGLMERSFMSGPEAGTPDNVHDGIVFHMHEDRLMERFHANKDRVMENMAALVPDIDLSGQWSVDIMQNGDDFYIIDLAPAATSALADMLPPGTLWTEEEDWLPKRFLIRNA